MALAVNDLIYPSGDLLPSMFPDNDIVPAVTVWLHESVDRTGDLTAQRSWIYYRAYTAVANRIAATPNNENSFGTHSTSWGSDRIQAFRDLAAANLAEYTRLTGDGLLTNKVVAGFTVY